MEREREVGTNKQLMAAKEEGEEESSLLITEPLMDRLLLEGPRGLVASWRRSKGKQTFMVGISHTLWSDNG